MNKKPVDLVSIFEMTSNIMLNLKSNWMHSEKIVFENIKNPFKNAGK